MSKNLLTGFAIIFLGLAWTAPVPASSNLHPFDEIAQTPLYQSQLKEILQQAVAHNFGTGGSIPTSLGPPFEKSTGLFITAKRDGKVLGCMGTIQPQQPRLAEEIFYNLQKAFSQDPRHRPVSQNQLKDLQIVLTAVDTPVRVENIAAINPARDSVLIRQGAKEAVVLAGEARTLRYLLAFAKAKAGIKPGESFQVYRLSAHQLIVSL